jgi:hypothetical protein
LFTVFVNHILEDSVKLFYFVGEVVGQYSELLRGVFEQVIGRLLAGCVIALIAKRPHDVRVGHGPGGIFGEYMVMNFIGLALDKRPKALSLTGGRHRYPEVVQYCRHDIDLADERIDGSAFCFLVGD